MKPVLLLFMMWFTMDSCSCLGDSHGSALALTQEGANHFVAKTKSEGRRGVLKERELVSSPEAALSLAVAAWQALEKQRFSSLEGFIAFRVDDCWYVTSKEPRVGVSPGAIIRAADGAFIYVTMGGMGSR